MDTISSYFLTWQAVVLVAALATAGPSFLRILSVPVLVILSPLFVTLLLLACITANIAVSHAFDRNKLRFGSRKRLGHAAQPFSFSTPAAWQAVLTRSQWSYASPHSAPPLIPDSPSVSSSLNDIFVLIVRDFVLSWYKDISPSPSFPGSVSNTLRHACKAIILRLERVDLPALIVKRVLPIINAHIDNFCESEKALRGVGLERRLTQSDELDLVLASRYATRGGKRLHPAVDNLSTMLTRPTEEVYLRSLVEKALPLVLPSEDSGSGVVHIAAREIVTVAVLVPLMEMFGDPDFWNRTIDLFVRVYGSHL
jgi:sorting nexin-25